MIKIILPSFQLNMLSFINKQNAFIFFLIMKYLNLILFLNVYIL